MISHRLHHKCNLCVPVAKLQYAVPNGSEIPSVVRVLELRYGYMDLAIAQLITFSPSSTYMETATSSYSSSYPPPQRTGPSDTKRREKNVNYQILLFHVIFVLHCKRHPKNPRNEFNTIKLSYFSDCVADTQSRLSRELSQP